MKNKLKFSLPKCEYTISRTGGRFSRIPTISLSGERLNYKPSINYLGVKWDGKRSWVPHLTKLKDKVTANITRLAGISCATSGIMKQIYLYVTKKQILYAADAWYDGTYRKIRHLNSIQRIALIKNTKCFRTVSTAALQVLAGVPPEHLSCDAIYKKYQHQNKKIQLEGESYTFEDIDIPDQKTT